MFRVSQYMQEIARAISGESAGSPPGTSARRRGANDATNEVIVPAAKRLPGPVVIWNLIRRCNLACKHCYSISADKDFPGELSSKEVCEVMDNLRQFGVPVLILSGGEPLLRPDIYEIARRAKHLDFYVGLSSNGTLITEQNIGEIADVGFDYVGVSLDGIQATHDRFRRMEGAFDKSLNAIRLCRDAGTKIGVRFTMTRDNAHDLPALLRLVEDEGIDRFYFSHLNYAGRGNVNRKDDARHQMTRQAMDLLFDTCWDYQQRGLKKEFTTGNNDADGVYFLFWVQRSFPQLADAIRARLVQWGGNASGVNVANIDNLGNVHPDTMWWHYTLGNVRERPFSEIWQDVSDPVMAGLKHHPRQVKGRCGACRHFDICGGNTRVRAQQLTGDPWEEDPGCYLTDEEIGVTATRGRIKVTPYSRQKAAKTGARA
ncbi:MAG: heme d1 biosynthesis radical SAM protein NirJ [Betaproteobacteria bacterium]|nr:heme d1 biosynthesis radical SAM protein NirJ [Betaproteobacteria bacterium]